ncbi:Rz-like spanin [Ralstonia phage phiAp1]|uniref:O-spanin n=1 Tax=Ralstonia phage phiAp1 TaxID=2783867 RepID=A0A1L7DS90_9CAUD|nr:Rz-like spanin [Ralstonia phage phiAp1]APU03194.1 O-spanin [Ralstonia phage phiAp1]
MPSLTRSRAIVLGLISLCLTTLQACSSVPQVQPQQAPDPALYAAPVPEPTLPYPLTNGALVEAVVAYREALGLANADRAAIKAWVQTFKEKQ